jgi:protein-tyrosine phosphatase
MIRFRTLSSLTALAAMALAAPVLAQTGQPVEVIRTAPTTVDVRWTGIKAADVFRADTPDTTVATATPVSANDRDGHETVTLPAGARGWFLVRDRATGTVTRAVERVVPLEQGSNFRDIGGYPAAGGKTVRWGMIYRAGATPLLSDADLATIGTLRLNAMVDLRSDEERQLAPTRIDGVRYTAVGYSMKRLMAASGSVPSTAARSIAGCRCC